MLVNLIIFLANFAKEFYKNYHNNKIKKPDILLLMDDNGKYKLYNNSNYCGYYIKPRIILNSKLSSMLNYQGYKELNCCESIKLGVAESIILNIKQEDKKMLKMNCLVLRTNLRTNFKI